MPPDNKFLKLINNQRSKNKIPKFKGTFLNYLQTVQDNPGLVQLSHKRLYKSIQASGESTIDVGQEGYRPFFNGEKLRTYEYFKKELTSCEIAFEFKERIYI